MPVSPAFAFPFQHHQKFSIHDPMVSSMGLSKLEYFSIVALQGLLSNPQLDLSQLTEEQRQNVVNTSVAIADDLMRTLEAYENAYETETYPEDYGAEESAPQQGADVSI